jgi:inosose dehydratase
VKLAAAPISWGVCEVPDWGVQLAPRRVLADIAALGITATEAGPPGFLPADARDARRLLERERLRLVGGFVTAVLHEESRRRGEMAVVERQAAWLADAGAEVVVLAASSGASGYAAVPEMTDAQWRSLVAGVDAVGDIAARHGLAVAVHPHFGTMIERAHHVERFLAESAHDVCLDSGHLALGGADPAATARQAGRRVRHVHLKDVDEALARAVREGAISYNEGVRRGLYVALGDGAAGVAQVVALLRQAGYGGWYVLEQDVMLEREPGDGPPEWVKRSVEYARRHA